MEAAMVATPEAPPETFDGAAEATRSADELFSFSTYVHVGAGAEECEQRLEGCDDPAHFHAWVCVPNVFQARDIAEKAKAARSRRRRALRDPESDSYAVLEDELDVDVRSLWETLLERVARKRTDDRLLDIIEELKDDERFENQAQDAEEFRRLLATAEEDRDAEEFDRLAQQMDEYATTFGEISERHVKNEIESLRRGRREDVIELERTARIDRICHEVYQHTYFTWAIYVGTREPTPGGFSAKRKFAAPENLRSAPPEVVSALRDAVLKLDQGMAQRSDAAGN